MPHPVVQGDAPGPMRAPALTYIERSASFRQWDRLDVECLLCSAKGFAYAPRLSRLTR